MTATRTVAALATAVVLPLLASGCAGSGDSGGSAPQSSAPSSVSAADMSDQQQAPARLVIDVTVENGAVLPADQQLQGKVGQPVVVRINSDAADQLLARGAREHTFPVEAKAGQSFQFTPDAPGPVTITLQTLNQTVATVDVTQ